MNNSCEISDAKCGMDSKEPVVTDSFSWRRVAMIARFYYPILRKQLIAMPIAVFVCVLVSSYAISVYESELMMLVSSLPIALMMMLAPIGLARRDCRFLSDQLPVTAMEKFVFLMLYFNFVVMLITSGGSFLSALLLMPVYSGSMTWLLNIYDTFEEMFGTSPWNPLFWPSSSMFQCFTLYGVISARKNRMAKGLIYMFASFVIYQLICGIGGIVIGFLMVGSGDVQNPSPFDVNQAIKSMMPQFFWILITLMTIGTIILACLIYRKLKYRGF